MIVYVCWSQSPGASLQMSVWHPEITFQVTAACPVGSLPDENGGRAAVTWEVIIINTYKIIINKYISLYNIHMSHFFLNCSSIELKSIHLLVIVG